MGDVRWDLISQYPNAGASFAQSFTQGLQQNKEQAGRNALAKLVTNPSDPQALQAAAQYDPSAALQVQQSQRKYTDEEHQHWAKYAGELAKWATDPQKWDQAIDYIVRQGHPEAAQLKGHFSPALREHFMAQGGIQDDAPVQDPAMIREFDIATQRGLVPPGTTFTQFAQMMNPGMSSPVTIPYGSTVNPGGQGAPPITATGPNGQKVQLNPQSGQWEPMGGQSPQGSGGFR
jgi:hypothetical protein